MKFLRLISLTLLAVYQVSAFLPLQGRYAPQSAKSMLSSTPGSSVSTDSAPAEIPITKDNIEFAAGVLGGFVGMKVGGPIMGTFCAAMANYASKKENTVGEVVGSASKTAIELCNLAARIERQNHLLQAAQTTIKNTTDNLKQKSNFYKTVIQNVENGVTFAVNTTVHINDKYHVVNASLAMLDKLGDFIEDGVTKVWSWSDGMFKK